MVRWRTRFLDVSGLERTVSVTAEVLKFGGPVAGAVGTGTRSVWWTPTVRGERSYVVAKQSKRVQEATILFTLDQSRVQPASGSCFMKRHAEAIYVTCMARRVGACLIQYTIESDERKAGEPRSFRNVKFL